MFEIKVVEKVKTRVLSSVIFFSSENHVYEIMWKNIVQPNRPQVIIRHTCIACWIPKATNTHSQ
jgi:hypothetical protein